MKETIGTKKGYTPPKLLLLGTIKELTLAKSNVSSDGGSGKGKNLAPANPLDNPGAPLP